MGPAFSWTYARLQRAVGSLELKGKNSVPHFQVQGPEVSGHLFLFGTIHAVSSKNFS